MLRLAIILITTFLYSSILIAQDDLTFQKTFKNDVSFNVTSLLGNLLSLNTNDTGVPYFISYRRHNGIMGFRVSLAGDIAKSTDNLFFNSSTDNYINLRVGIEKINQISSKVVVSYGIDILANYFSEESVLITSNNIFNQKDEIKELGLGPSVRLSYQVNPRVSFHTESSMYALVGRSETTYGSNFIQDESKDTFRLRLAIPQALFITLSF